MSRPIEQALHNLIPRHPGSLPPELVELASSLLAQSRNNASNLKAEEEIGRTYACANLACERLKTTLNLPPIEPRPPLPPRIYNKLYAHLDRTLISNTPRKRSRSQHSISGSNGLQKSLPQRHTPSKEKALEDFRTGSRSDRKGLNSSSSKQKGQSMPAWIPPAVRMLCRELQSRNAVPHVLAGVESVLCLPPPEQDTEDARHAKRERQEKLPALVAAVWFFVSCRMLGKDTDGDEYVNRRKVVLDVLRKMRDDTELTRKVGDDEGAWDGWVDVEDGDVTAWVKELTMKGWLDLDWFLNIEKGEIDDVVEQEDQEERGSRRSKEDLQRAGLGTMKLKRYDYLSEANRNAYKRWKALMLFKIEEMIKEGALVDDSMDTRDG